MQENKLKFYQCFYQLITDAKWVFVDKNADNVVLKKSETQLFCCEKEKWVNIPETKITISPNLKFMFNGQLSIFDCEILEFYGFKKGKNLLKNK